MKKTVRDNVNPAYTLHDMQVRSFRVREDCVTMYTSTGLVKTLPPGGQTDGYVEFHRVQWDFSYAYLLRYEGLAGNIGPFQGEKMFLREFLHRYPSLDYVILDETYGYHQTKYGGFLDENGTMRECMLEICHDGDMLFVSEE